MNGFVRGVFISLLGVGTFSVQPSFTISDVTVPAYDDDSLGSLCIDRTHHAAVYDVVTEQYHHPFAFMPSPLDDALRLGSFLLGEVYAAAESYDVRDHIIAHIDTFSDRVLDLYALYWVAQIDINYQIGQRPERMNYLLGEVGHLRERIAVLLDSFSEVMSVCKNDYVSAVKVTLERMMRKSAFFLES